MSTLQPEDSTYVSSIVFDVLQQFGKTVDHITLKTKSGRFTREIAVTLSPGQQHKEEFGRDLELSRRDRLSIVMRHQPRSFPWTGTSTITVKQSKLVKEARVDEHGNRIYMKAHDHIVVSMNISRHAAAGGSSHDPPLPSEPTTVENSHIGPLPPSSSEILRICPRFRLLIIGNTGVGKSTLIQKVFGVKDVDVSEDSRGRAEINREFVAADNGLFVLHDSVGLEGGESNNLEKVKHFIDDRRKQAHVKDKLHAVWLCLAVPYAKGRLLEAGVEEFLRDRRKILGNIPIVVVLTKVDLLDGKLMQTLGNEGVEFKSMEEAQPTLEPLKKVFLEQYCAQPLQRAAQGDIPRVAVSTRGGFKLEPTISELVRTTTSEIERYIKADPAYATAAEQPSIEHSAPLYIAGMAQRASIETNVDLTIALGKRRYWTNLGASFKFSNDKVKEYLLVIHQDIIQVWNFNDPAMILQGDDFKTALLETSNLGVQDIRDAPAVLGSVVPLVSALGGLLTDVLSVAVALPVATGVVLAKLIFAVYESTQTIVKRFMAYITDLIYVLRILFVLAPQGQAITSRDVALALKVYDESAYRNRVHLEIKDFSTNLAILPGGRDMVVEKIEVLIRRYSITDEEVSRVRAQIRASEGSLSSGVSASS